VCSETARRDGVAEWCGATLSGDPPLALDAGFAFERIEEAGSRDFPVAIAVRCT
jgi:hypothetical protein